tara:strand:+ start:162 stop:329 length:168 start_codon:yes stop_codon:yes gene_type:complete
MKKRKPPFPNIYGASPYTVEKKRQKINHDKFCWRVGLFVMTILTASFIWVLVEIL